MPISDESWTEGCCSTFSAALRERFGGELYAVVNHSNRYPDDDYLLHAYCIIDGVPYDANGPHTLAEASDTAAWGAIPDMDKDHEVTVVWREVSLDWFEQNHEDYNPEDYVDAFAYMERNRHLFPVSRRQ